MKARSVFISYRRDDSSADAGRLFDRLAKRFTVFMDIDTIGPGENFADRIRDAVGECDALVAVIGKNWLTITDEDGRRRLDDEEDFVRLEIVAALERNVRVIPVLVQGAKMPRKEELPDPLKPLALRNALELNHLYWDYQVGRLIKALGGRRWWADPRAWIAAAVVGGAVTAAAAVSRNTGEGEPAGGEAQPGGDGALAATEIAFLSDQSGSCNVHVTRFDRRDQRQLTRETGGVLRPDWSPDGERIAYSSERDGGYDIVIADARTGEESHVIDAGGDEKGPDWSPAGDRISFSRIASGASEIWSASSDGKGEPVQLTFDGSHAIVPEWNTTGDRIAYSSRVDGDLDIYVIPAEGGDPTNLTGELFGGRVSNESGVQWSPDGSQIVFEATAGGDYDIYVMPAEGGTPQNLTAHSARDRYPSWSPDGTKIVYGSDRLVPADDTQTGCAADERQQDLFVMNGDGSDQVRLIQSEADDSAPAWGPTAE